MNSLFSTPEELQAYQVELSKFKKELALRLSQIDTVEVSWWSKLKRVFFL